HVTERGRGARGDGGAELGEALEVVALVDRLDHHVGVFRLEAAHDLVEDVAVFATERVPEAEAHAALAVSDGAPARRDRAGERPEGEGPPRGPHRILAPPRSGSK